MYHVLFLESTLKTLKKYDKYTQRIILDWIIKHLEGCEDPRAHGKVLSMNRVGEWRYRIGDYRLICLIKDKELIILAIVIGHRKDFIKNKKGTLTSNIILACLFSILM